MDAQSHQKRASAIKTLSASRLIGLRLRMSLAFLTCGRKAASRRCPLRRPGRRGWKGKAALAEQYAIVPASYRRIHYPELGFRELGDPEWTMAEYRCEAEISSNGNRYDNNYLGLFRHAPDGRIEVFREYFNPTPLEQAMMG